MPVDQRGKKESEREGIKEGERGRKNTRKRSYGRECQVSSREENRKRPRSWTDHQGRSGYGVLTVHMFVGEKRGRKGREELKGSGAASSRINIAVALGPYWQKKKKRGNQHKGTKRKSKRSL